MQFTKLFNSILDSTIWQEPLETKVVWITMLAMVDRNGELHASIPGLAKRAGVTIPQCNAALSCLESPDEYSRTKDHQGRRIREIDGGWELLNHGKYRALLSAEERREYNKRKQAEYRANKRLISQESVNDMSLTVNYCQSQSAMSTHTEAEAEPKKENNKRVAFHAPSLSELEEYGNTLDPKFSKASTFIDFYESNGWKVGKNPMKDWRAAVRTWNSKENRQPLKANQMGLSGINSSSAMSL